VEARAAEAELKKELGDDYDDMEVYADKLIEREMRMVEKQMDPDFRPTEDLGVYDYSDDDDAIDLDALAEVTPL
jgi:hypothetical protein